MATRDELLLFHAMKPRRNHALAAHAVAWQTWVHWRSAAAMSASRRRRGRNLPPPSPLSLDTPRSRRRGPRRMRRHDAGRAVGRGAEQKMADLASDSRQAADVAKLAVFGTAVRHRKLSIAEELCSRRFGDNFGTPAWLLHSDPLEDLGEGWSRKTMEWLVAKATSGLLASLADAGIVRCRSRLSES
jgi:hypothetical protein